MKTSIKLFSALLAAIMIFQGCSDSKRIIGEGSVITEELTLQEFSKIEAEGVDDVYISYGEEQKVVVKGHGNIIDLIEKDVINNTWNLRLKDGNYGKYELTYYLTLPTIEKVHTSGTGDVVINDEMYMDYFKLSLEGTGNFYGFNIVTKESDINIEGTGDCEITTSENIKISIEGTGKVYYKGTPSVESKITGSGKVINVN